MSVCGTHSLFTDAGSDLLLNSNEISAEFVSEFNWQRVQGTGCGK
jgi:hypothetical protein